ncbi:MAG: outer membrane beta-barrel protein [Ignavibacteria bacterium]
MKTLKIFTLVSLLLVLMSGSAVSQVKFALGPTLGLTLPTGDYSGTTLDYYVGTKYGQSTGLNLGLVVKAGLGPIINIRVAGIFSFLKNEGNSEPGQGFIEVKNGLFMISAGPEFSFKLPASPVKPYAGVDLLFTSISGETSFQGVSRVPSGTFDMSTASRIGLGFGAGVEYTLSKKYILDFTIRFNLINLTGKEFEDVNPTDDRRLDSYLALNDAKDPVYPTDIDKHPIGNDRSISVVMFNLAFLFGF